MNMKKKNRGNRTTQHRPKYTSSRRGSQWSLWQILTGWDKSKKFTVREWAEAAEVPKRTANYYALALARSGCISVVSEGRYTQNGGTGFVYKIKKLPNYGPPVVDDATCAVKLGPVKK